MAQHHFPEDQSISFNATISFDSSKLFKTISWKWSTKERRGVCSSDCKTLWQSLSPCVCSLLALWHQPRTYGAEARAGFELKTEMRMKQLSKSLKNSSSHCSFSFLPLLRLALKQRISLKQWVSAELQFVCCSLSFFSKRWYESSVTGRLSWVNLLKKKLGRFNTLAWRDASPYFITPEFWRKENMTVALCSHRSGCAAPCLKDSWSGKEVPFQCRSACGVLHSSPHGPAIRPPFVMLPTGESYNRSHFLFT